MSNNRESMNQTDSRDEEIVGTNWSSSPIQISTQFPCHDSNVVIDGQADKLRQESIEQFYIGSGLLTLVNAVIQLGQDNRTDPQLLWLGFRDSPHDIRVPLVKEFHADVRIEQVRCHNGNLCS